MFDFHSATQTHLCPPGGESTVIGVNVFKFSLQLSGRFILPVVAANGCITTGSGLRGFSDVGGRGHLLGLRARQTPTSAVILSPHTLLIWAN